jgi:hypothetical protein
VFGLDDSEELADEEDETALSYYTSVRPLRWDGAGDVQK